MKTFFSVSEEGPFSLVSRDGCSRAGKTVGEIRVSTRWQQNLSYLRSSGTHRQLNDWLPLVIAFLFKPPPSHCLQRNWAGKGRKTLNTLHPAFGFFLSWSSCEFLCVNKKSSLDWLAKDFGGVSSSVKLWCYSIRQKKHRQSCEEGKLFCVS